MHGTPRLQAAQEALAAAEQAAVDKAADIRSMEKQLKATRKAMESAATDEKAAEEALAALEASVGELRGRVEQRRADRSSAANQGRVVAGLMDAKRKGALKGIHGRLGDLGAVDAKYDVAASTAISALDYIVVDSTADAQTAVEHLRRNNLGVATFLILDKQQHLATAAAKSAMPPEGVARLFDLVKCDNPRLRVAFYYAMRDTVVANDLDQAARIAYGGDGRWRRVVTLKGEMINESGTMTGGGGKPRGGRICLGKAAPKTVDGAELEAALAADEQTLGQQLEVGHCSASRESVNAPHHNMLLQFLCCAKGRNAFFFSLILLSRWYFQCAWIIFAMHGHGTGAGRGACPVQAGSCWGA